MAYDIENSFHSNDIRGVYGKEVDEKLFYITARAFSKDFRLKGKEVVVGRDIRNSSPSLAKSFIKGLVDSGVNVLDIGIVSTPAVYFASGRYKKHGAMITASHNPKDNNGLKLTMPGAYPIGGDNGLGRLKRAITKDKFPVVSKKGKIRKKNIIKEYVKYVHSFIDLKNLKPMKIVVDTGNGIEGIMVPKVYKDLPIDIVPMYFKPSGNFPNHPANPADPENLKAIIKRLKKAKDERFGMAFDTDGDRIFFIDEKGQIVPSAVTGALIMKYLFKKYPHEKAVCSLISSKILFDISKEMGIKVMKGKVGHSYIKKRMRQTHAIFGVEHSGHFYYRHNFYADSGIITSLIVCEILSQDPRPFSVIVKPYRIYAELKEHSVKVKDRKKAMEKIEKYYEKQKPLKVDKFDGITITFPDYWINVRISNTDPVLRVNMEADSGEILEKKKKELFRLFK